MVLQVTIINDGKQLSKVHMENVFKYLISNTNKIY